MKQVADVELEFELGVIERRDRESTLSLNVQLHPFATAAELTAFIKPWLAEAALDWPGDHTYEIGGKTESSGDANASIAAQLPVTGFFTILGLMPLLWGGTAMFKPMAITIIFGLTFATILTLLVVPVLYAMFFRVSFRDGSQAVEAS